MNAVNLKHVELALNHVDGHSFESFANVFMSEILGDKFIPLGGTNDGGADGLMEREDGPSYVFLQTSIQEDVTSKVKQTVNRLAEVGREVRTLYYVCPQTIPRLDQFEDKLSETHNISVKIRDGKFIVANVNESVRTRAAYQSYLSPSIAFLSEYKNSWVSTIDGDETSPSVYVFLRSELERRDTDVPSDALVDGLIIWTLRNTDPEKNIFLTQAEIADAIDRDIPGMKEIVCEGIEGRLRSLRSTAQNNQRPIRYYKEGDKYCLAFDLRQKLGNENVEAEALKIKILDTYKERIQNTFTDYTPEIVAASANLAFKTIEKALENEGVEFAAFLTGHHQEKVSLSKHIHECIENEGAKFAEIESIAKSIAFILDEAFDNPTAEERLLYSRLGSVYTILFCLRTEPKLLIRWQLRLHVIDCITHEIKGFVTIGVTHVAVLSVIRFFEDMAGHFSLYVGADVLILALSERSLPSSHQIFQNTLKLVKEAGGHLILADTVIDEVQHHIYSTTLEFKNYYLECEMDILKSDDFEFINKPLIRAYFEIRKANERGAPKNWFQFINNFCNPQQVRTNVAKHQIRKYLTVHFKMDYESREQMEQACSARDVKGLAWSLAPYKSDKKLAYNDSLMVHAVYAKRQSDGENRDVNVYGMKTWWLTNEFTVTNFTHELVEAEGVRYLMRPDYLLNFLTFLPKKPKVRKIINELFPSMLGVHLARMHTPEHVTMLHEHLDEAKSMDSSRRTVAISDMMNKLKGDLRKPSWLQFSNDDSSE